MSIEFKPEPREGRPRITVIGVGGAGGNAVNNMIAGKLEGVEFVVANTDAQSLDQSLAEHRIQLGASITHGLGAGARPDIGKVSAEEAGLRYVSDTGPGVRRRRVGKAFTYIGPDGARITDPDRLAWIKSLACWMGVRLA